MNSCQRCRAQLGQFLDGTLSASAQENVAAHLQTCPDCAQELRFMEATQAALHDIAPVPAPPELRLRVRAALQNEAAQRQKEKPDFLAGFNFWKPQRFAWAGTVTLSAVVLLVLARPFAQNPIVLPTGPDEAASEAPAGSQTVIQAPRSTTEKPKSKSAAPSNGRATAKPGTDADIVKPVVPGKAVTQSTLPPMGASQKATPKTAVPAKPSKEKPPVSTTVQQSNVRPTSAPSTSTPPLSPAPSRFKKQESPATMSSGSASTPMFRSSGAPKDEAKPVPRVFMAPAPRVPAPIAAPSRVTSPAGETPADTAMVAGSVGAEMRIMTKSAVSEQFTVKISEVPNASHQPPALRQNRMDVAIAGGGFGGGVAADAAPGADKQNFSGAKGKAARGARDTAIAPKNFQFSAGAARADGVSPAAPNLPLANKLDDATQEKGDETLRARTGALEARSVSPASPPAAVTASKPNYVASLPPASRTFMLDISAPKAIKDAQIRVELPATLRFVADDASNSRILWRGDLQQDQAVHMVLSLQGNADNGKIKIFLEQKGGDNQSRVLDTQTLVLP